MTEKNENFEQNLHEGSNEIGTDKKRTLTKEADSRITEVLSVLSDPVTRAIFRHVVETGGCSTGLMTMTAVVEEGESLLTGLIPWFEFLYWDNLFKKRFVFSIL